MEEIEKKEFVSFEATYEFSCLVEILEEQYPSLTSGKIQNTIDLCLKKTQQPRQRNEFIKILKDELGIEWENLECKM